MVEVDHEASPDGAVHIGVGCGVTAVSVAVGVAALGVGGLARITLPQSVSAVPVTGQTFVAALIGVVQGPYAGGISTLVHAVLWSGVSGVRHPHGGFVWGFVPCAAITGYLTQSGIPVVAAAVAGQATTLVTGAAWLVGIVGVVPVVAWNRGVVPFFPGLLIKSVGVWVLLCLGNTVRNSA